MVRFTLLILIAISISLPARAADIIGLSLPLKGRFAPVSERMEFGALMAAARLKEAGRDVDLLLVDDGCNPKTAPETAKKLIDGKAKIVVGPTCFALAEALARSLKSQTTEKPPIPVVTANTRNKLLKRLRGVDELSLYSVSSTHDGEARAVVDLILPAFGGKPFAIIDDGSVYGRALADDVRLIGELAGYKPVMTANFRPLQTTQISLLRRLQNSGVEALFIAAGPEDLITVTRDMQTLDLNWLVGTGEQLELLPYTANSQDAAEGIFMVQETYANSLADDAAFKDIDVEPSLLMGHALIEIGAAAVQQKLSHLTGKTFQTILGPLKFDAEGRAAPVSYSLLRWDGGSFVAVSGN